MSSIITRFAPSPTGKIHVGNARTALICFLFAQKHGAKFLLRIDDTDVERCQSDYVQDIKDCLGWMGINYNNCFHQGNRFSRYKEVFDLLLAQGRIYPCYETPEEIEFKRRLQLKSGRPPIYDRSALKLDKSTLEKYKKEGRKAHFRFKLNESEAVSWDDLVKGEIKINLSNFSDPVVMRSDGSYTYMLPSVIDDIDHRITHVIRGEDHVTNTALQIDMIKALDESKKLQFAHIALLHNKDGKLSKRSKGMSIEEVRSRGIESVAMVNYLTKIGVSNQDEEICSMKDLSESFDISVLSGSSVLFDFNDLLRINRKLVHSMGFDQVRSRLSLVDKQFWDAVKGNIDTVEEAFGWWRICNAEIVPVCVNKELLEKAAQLLEQEEWDSGVWKRWIASVRKHTSVSGKDLFMPIRLALTASESGPELANMFPFIGKQRAINRLLGKTS